MTLTKMKVRTSSSLNSIVFNGNVLVAKKTNMVQNNMHVVWIILKATQHGEEDWALQKNSSLNAAQCNQSFT